jgi:hypothetical protein
MIQHFLLLCGAFKFFCRHEGSQGCQMVCFQTKNSNLGKFSRALDRKNGYILWPFGIFYGHLGFFMTIWDFL